MNMLRSWLRPTWPGWPPFAPGMGLWAALLGLCRLSLRYRQELWPHTPHAGYWAQVGSLVAWLALLGLAGQAFWRWPRRPQSPLWVRLAQALVAWGAVLLLALVAGVALIWGVVLLWRGPGIAPS